MKERLKSLVCLALILFSIFLPASYQAATNGETQTQTTYAYSGSNLCCAVELYSKVNHTGTSIYILESSITPDFPYWVSAKSVTVWNSTNVKFNATIRGTKATPTDNLTAYHNY